MKQYNEQQRECGPRYVTVADVQGSKGRAGGEGGGGRCDGQWIDVRVRWGGGREGSCSMIYSFSSPTRSLCFFCFLLLLLMSTLSGVL